ncbi:hypothetical protein [Thauera sp. WH-1]
MQQTLIRQRDGERVIGTTIGVTNRPVQEMQIEGLGGCSMRFR